MFSRLAIAVCLMNDYDALSDYLRSTLPRLRGGAAMEMPTLGAQIEICKNYLALMKIRMGGRLNFRIDVPEEAASAPFPPLLLLPLVENAVKHGIEPKPGPAVICILALLDQGELTVTVQDDGLGLRAETGSGLGLQTSISCSASGMPMRFRPAILQSRNLHVSPSACASAPTRRPSPK